MTNNKDWTRREFVTTLAGAGAGIVLNPFSAWAINEVDPKIARIAAGIIGIDAHNHIDVPFDTKLFAGQKYDLSEAINKSGLTAICMTFCVDRPALATENEAYNRFITSLNEMDELLAANNLTRALNYSDLKKAHEENRKIVIQSAEGGHFIEGKLERIQIAYDRGLRHLGLLHDNQSSVPLGDIYTDAPKFGGLTPMGTDVIKACNTLGILVDLAHCSNGAINDALEIATKPLLISHAGLNTQLGQNEQMAKMMMPRLISKEQAKIVANAGGAIGVWTHLADSPLAYANNIRAMAEAVGIEHVCIGTDTKMAVPENASDRFGRQTNQIWENEKQGFFYTVVDAMLKSGFTEKEISKIGGDNYCRIFDRATAV